jgi:hypothetical protein
MMPETAHHPKAAQLIPVALDVVSAPTSPMPNPSMVSKTCTIREATTPMATADQVQPAVSIVARGIVFAP